MKMAQDGQAVHIQQVQLDLLTELRHPRESP
jgi:hypothetical protein